MPWFVWLIVALAFNVLAYLIMPKPKTDADSQTPETDNPTAQAGKPIPIIFGEKWVKDPNILWYGDKKTGEYEVKA